MSIDSLAAMKAMARLPTWSGLGLGLGLGLGRGFGLGLGLGLGLGIGFGLGLVLGLKAVARLPTAKSVIMTSNEPWPS